ncbi:hypothetical protein B0T17DRAFT_544259 [Bombardia bombarda]|uniref:Uncharacterized protein n=1 Tax=Bombardia bombarda TaxID=252184 RepID=A0AA39U7E4_9PEZI|nr:hypothetical protein B0T17DRAFT_544259 [Bombardia bombarda]
MCLSSCTTKPIIHRPASRSNQPPLATTPLYHKSPSPASRSNQPPLATTPLKFQANKPGKQTGQTNPPCAPFIPFFHSFRRNRSGHLGASSYPPGLVQPPEAQTPLHDDASAAAVRPGGGFPKKEYIKKKKKSLGVFRN